MPAELDLSIEQPVCSERRLVRGNDPAVLTDMDDNISTVTQRTEEQLNVVNIKMNNFVLNRAQTIKKKLSKMDDVFKVTARDQRRQFKLEMSTPTYHIFMENITNLGRKYGCSIKRDDVDEEGDALKTQYNVTLCTSSGKKIPTSLTCYHTNNSMLVQLKKSEHPIEERKNMLENFITNTIKGIIAEVENSKQHGCVKDKLRFQLVQAQHSENSGGTLDEGVPIQVEGDATTLSIVPSSDTHLHVTTSTMSLSSPASPAASSAAGSHRTPPRCVNINKASLASRGFQSFQDWNSNPDNIYIGRDQSHHTSGAVGSKWQNPFPSDKYGREKCLQLYQEHVRGRADLLASIIELEGKQIGCWCKPSPCHGDLLVEMFKEMYVDTNPALTHSQPSLVKSFESTPVGVRRAKRSQSLKRELEIAEGEGEAEKESDERSDYCEEDPKEDPKETDTASVVVKLETSKKECEKLGTELFHKHQELKKANDEIKNLRDTNTYRQAVIILEQRIATGEEEKTKLREELEKERKEKVEVVERSGKETGEKSKVITNLEKEMKEQEVLLKEKLNTIVEKNQMIESLKASVEKLKNEKRQLVDERTSNVETIKKLESEGEDKGERISSLETTIEELKEYKKAAQDKMEKEISMEENLGFLRDENAKQRSTIRLLKQDGKSSEIIEFKKKESEQLEQIKEDIKALRILIHSRLDCKEGDKTGKAQLLPSSAPTFSISSVHSDRKRQLETEQLQQLDSQQQEQQHQPPQHQQQQKPPQHQQQRQHQQQQQQQQRQKQQQEQQKQQALPEKPQHHQPNNQKLGGSKCRTTSEILEMFKADSVDKDLDFKIKRPNSNKQHQLQTHHQENNNNKGNSNPNNESSNIKSNRDVSLNSVSHQALVHRNGSSLRYHPNNPQTKEANPDESGRTLRIVPGKESYSETLSKNDVAETITPDDDTERSRRIQNIKDRREKREKKTLVFSSSIAKDINFREFNDELNVGSADFHIFKGKKAKDISRYMIPHIEDENPTDVVFVAGGNDLPNKVLSQKSISEVAECIIRGGLECKNHGVSNVYVSSILPRADSYFQINRMKLNQVLRSECAKHNFVFIENDDIILRHHVCSDEVHLTKAGSRLLKQNILAMLNA